MSEVFHPDQLIGERVGGRFVVERLIGTGPLSSAFRARDQLLERRVTVKLFHPQHPDDSAVVDSQLQLASAVARLSHPNIVTVIDRGEHEGLPFVVLEYVRGENLEERIDRFAPLDVGEVIGYGLSIARALAYAHAQGVTHGNIRPVNLLISEDRDIKIVDFGGGSYLASLTGADPYVAPEQRVLEGPHVAPSALDDVYALGVLLHVALTESAPVLGGDTSQLQLMRPDAPNRLVQLVVRATSPDPVSRVASMQEVASELAAIRGRSSSSDAAISGANRFVTPDAPAAAGSTPEPSSTDAPALSPWESHAPASIDHTSQVAVTPFGADDQPRRGDRPMLRSGRELRARLLAWSMAIIPLVGVILIAVVIAGERGSAGRRAATADASLAARQTVNLTRASSFDPLTNDSDQTEHQDLVQFLIDGKPGSEINTSWQTEGYEIRLPKAGVGVWVAAGSRVRATELRLRTDLEGWGYQVYATNDPEHATKLSDWTRVSEHTHAAMDKQPVVLNTRGVAYEAYLIWITRLAVDTKDTNKLRARIGEVVIRTP